MVGGYTRRSEYLIIAKVAVQLEGSVELCVWLQVSLTHSHTHVHSQVEIIQVEAIQTAYPHRLRRYRQTQSGTQQRAAQ